MEKVNRYIEKYRLGVRSTVTHPCLDLTMEANGGLIGFGCGTILGIVF